MRPADQIEATADRAVADLTALRATHARRRQSRADDAVVDEDGQTTVSDEADD
ncbi:hypothetical protein [Williamsia maris]|uniref:Uncharacterized protein n=1 Tax=Williamsia maris TaxID=72806 RepID=A0ABT1H8V9_9NOCA|nr:hypothetical protein [Williamsia maris]MCP2174407.1 hypothetical protein [Williamsia maris]